MNVPYLKAVALLGLSALLFGTATGQAQIPQGKRFVRFTNIKGKKVNSPEFTFKRVNSEGTRRLQWYQVRTTYETAREWIDELDMRYYALVKTKKPEPGEKAFKLLRGQVSYVNVAKGKHLSEVYFHPSTLARYGEVQRMAVLAYVQGQLQAMVTDPDSKDRWWEQLTPVDGFILNRAQSPYALINFDNFEAIKVPTSRP